MKEGMMPKGVYDRAGTQRARVITECAKRGAWLRLNELEAELRELEAWLKETEPRPE
jgi:hypothetical protein